jgi:hypothetical protein
MVVFLANMTLFWPIAALSTTDISHISASILHIQCFSYSLSCKLILICSMWRVKIAPAAIVRRFLNSVSFEATEILIAVSSYE